MKDAAVPQIHKYNRLRRTWGICKYGLERRAEAVARLFCEVPFKDSFRVLDIGTADGAMLRLLKRFSNAGFIGVEPNQALCHAARENGVTVVRSDGRHLPFAGQCYDVVLLSATLKHIKEYRQVLRECRRVIVPDGYLVVLDPTPFGLWLGSSMGHFDRRYLPNIWSLGETSRRVEAEGFEVLISFKYVVWPFPSTCARYVEAMLGRFHLTGTFLQQALLAQKCVVFTPGGRRSSHSEENANDTHREDSQRD